ncbi:MAG: tetratricopeptide repeat protein [Arenimonas sp.]|uniref:tetratricopeptide repeat protein n=1 Tax=Arenimonas sp. TaxID=1872635 RepID=UPI0025C19251|nr:tetratricopeptide repeat protein [Arenimonas sp.]MBW8369346.1 tetratricopeptide repeat protein [Arenimonas sp.]
MTTFVKSALGAIILLAIGLAAYWPGLSGGFLLDDYSNLQLNPDWKVTANEWAQWKLAFYGGVAGASGRSLAMLSFAVNHFLTGMAPWNMKLTNLVMHLANGLLVWALCRNLFRLAATKGPAPGDLTAWFIAAAWLLHPIQVSTVLYLVQRMEIGVQSFTLLSLLFYVAGRSRQLQGQAGARWLAAAMLSMLLGLGFKESALLLPAYFAVLELTLFGFRNASGERSRALTTTFLVGALLALAVFVFWLVPRYATADAYAIRDFTWVERLLTQPRVLAMHLLQMAWPSPESFLFYYDHIRPSTGLMKPPTTLLSMIVLAGLAALAIRVRRRRPLVAIGIGFFFIAHSLTSNIIPLEMVFEHRNYFALIGILLAVAGALGGRWPKTWEAGTYRGIAAAAILSLGGLTFMQASDWSNPLRLSNTLAARNFESVRANYALGSDWLSISGDDTSHVLWSLALKQFQHVASLPGNSMLGEQGQIIMLSRAGRPVPPEVWDQLRRKMMAKAATSQEELVLFALNDCRINLGCKLDDRQLQATLDAAVIRNPGSSSLHAQYANFAFNVMGNKNLAVALMQAALDIAPENPILRAGLIKFMLASGQVDDVRLQQELDLLNAANGDGSLDAELEAIRKLRTP